MRIFNIEKDNKKFMFINESRNTRHGFAHDSTMFINDVGTQTAHCYYLNRTWEMYTYQTACLSAVRQEIEQYKKEQIADFKELNGYKKMTAARAAQFEKEFTAQPYYETLKACYDELTTKCFY